MINQKFKHWFDTQLAVGGFPLKHATDFRPLSYYYIINVSDEYYPEIDDAVKHGRCQTFWFPMSEKKKIWA